MAHQLREDIAAPGCQTSHDKRTPLGTRSNLLLNHLCTHGVVFCQVNE